MNRKLIPTYLKESIFEINFERIKDLKYKYVFVDLDNTLSSPYIYFPEDRVFDLVSKIKTLGLTMFVISNNKQKRVDDFCKPLGINYLFNIKKPSSKKVKDYLDTNNINRKEVIIIGDQVLTDILLANKLNVDSILVNRLTNKDEPITFFPRLIDKIAKRIINKKNLSKEF